MLFNTLDQQMQLGSPLNDDELVSEMKVLTFIDRTILRASWHNTTFKQYAIN
jgi:hypothetical protein